jgi:hypothetical protein
MIQLILGNSIVNQISSKLLSGNSRVLKPVFVVLLITLSLFLLGIQQIFKLMNPRRYMVMKKDQVTQYKTA